MKSTEMQRKARQAVYIGTDNLHGNPRRGWLILSITGLVIDFVDEGYGGLSSLRDEYPELAPRSTSLIDVTPGYYRKVRKARRGF